MAKVRVKELYWLCTSTKWWQAKKTKNSTEGKKDVTSVDLYTSETKSYEYILTRMEHFNLGSLCWIKGVI